MKGGNSMFFQHRSYIITKQRQVKCHVLHYNSFFYDTKSLKHFMDLEGDRLQSCGFSFRLLTTFHNTYVSEDIMNYFIKHINSYKNKIVRIAIIGVPISHMAKFERKIYEAHCEHIKIRFFSNTSSAKVWLKEDKHVRTF